MRSRKSALKAFWLATDLSTHASPSTLRRCAIPSSRRCWSSMRTLLCHCEERSDEAIQFLPCCFWVASFRSQVTVYALPLRQKSDHRVRKGLRLLDIGDMGGVEDGHAGAWDLAADEFAGRYRRRRVVAAGNHQRRVLDIGQQGALVERAQRLAAGEITFYRRSHQHRLHPRRDRRLAGAKILGQPSGDH